jgi:hypothetical protein
MTVEQTKIVVKSQKCSMSAERKSAGRTTPICSEEQPGVFRHVKRTINGGQLICGSPGLKPPTAEPVAAPLWIVGARQPPRFLPPQCARIYSEFHTVSPAKFIPAGLDTSKPSIFRNVRSLNCCI